MKTLLIRLVIFYSIFVSVAYSEPLYSNVYQKSSQSEPCLTSFSLLNNKQARLSYWNHIATFPNEFSSRKLPNHYYQLSRSKVTHGIEMVLVKKLTDWNHQHGNGIEVNYIPEKFTLNSNSFIKLTLKVKPAESHIPLNKTIKQWLGDYYPNVEGLVENVAKIDNGKPYINVLLYGKNHQSLDIATTYASMMIDVSNTHSNTELNLPLNQFSFYRMKQYQKTAIALNQVNWQDFQGILLTAETFSGKTLRHLLQAQFKNHLPPLLNEVSVSIAEMKLCNGTTKH